MKIVFDIKDDATITNNTIKVIANVTGVVGDDNKEAVDQRIAAVASALFPNAEWAFSNYAEQGFTFYAQATTRVDAMENERLDERAESASTKTTEITIAQIDQSIPQRQMRSEESDLRVRMIGLAKAEAEKLGGTVNEIVFEDVRRMGMSQNSNRAFAATAMLESAVGEPKGIGHSEKISLGAKVTVVA